MPHEIPTIILNTDPKPGPDALAAYQLRIAAAKKSEHETIVNGILVDPMKTARLARELGEIDEEFFASPKKGGGGGDCGGGGGGEKEKKEKGKGKREKKVRFEEWEDEDDEDDYVLVKYHRDGGGEEKGGERKKENVAVKGNGFVKGK